MYFVYIIRCGDGSLYTGITTDVARRINEHALGTGAHYTRSKRFDALLHSEPHPHRSAASKREAEIKKWPRSKKLAFLGLAR